MGPPSVDLSSGMIGGSQQPPVNTPASGIDLSSGMVQSQTSHPGEELNDVGNTVIVPKDGESFTDTMGRAAAQGKRTTPDQINRETSTMPGKAATVLAAAPVMGFGGTAALAGAGAIPGVVADAAGQAKTLVLKKLAEATPQLFGHEAVKETLKRYALEGAKKALSGATWAGGAEILHSVWDEVFGKKK